MHEWVLSCRRLVTIPAGVANAVKIVRIHTKVHTLVRNRKPRESENSRGFFTLGADNA